MRTIHNDIRQLSSGTIATLTGWKNYSDIDSIRDEFGVYVRALENAKGVKFNTWVDAWDSFLDYLTKPRGK